MADSYLTAGIRHIIQVDTSKATFTKGEVYINVQNVIFPAAVYHSKQSAKTQFCSQNNLVLHSLGEVNEIRGKPRCPDHQIRVFLRMRLSVQ